MDNDPNITALVPAQIETDSLDQHAAEIRRLHKRAASDIVEIGRRLAICKERAGHGEWLPWLDREFGWKEQSARNFMQVYELSLKSPNFGDLGIGVSSLYLLAAPSTPEEARTEIIERAEKGEHLSVQAVKTTIAKARPHRAGRAIPAGKRSKPPAPKAALSTLAWSDSTVEQRRHFLDGAGLSSVREALPPTWCADELIRISDGRTTVEKARAVKAPAKPKIKKPPPVDLPDDPIQEPCTDCETPEQFWQRSLSNLAGDAISIRAFWTRQFGKWEKFAVPSELVTLAKQAAEAWQALAKTLASDAEVTGGAS
jgi:hypothetical protein